MGPMVRPLRQAHELQQLHDPVIALGWIGPDQAQRDLDVLCRGQDGHQPERLEDEGDGVAACVHELCL